MPAVLTSRHVRQVIMRKAYAIRGPICRLSSLSHAASDLHDLLRACSLRQCTTHSSRLDFLSHLRPRGIVGWASVCVLHYQALN